MEPRSVDAIIRLLLRRFERSTEPRILAWEQWDWPEGTATNLEAAGLIERADNEVALACDGCEYRCWVEPQVEMVRERPTLLHYCTERDDISYVECDADQLRTWRLRWRGVAENLARGLVGTGVVELVPGRVWSLGEFSKGEVLFAWGLHRGVPRPLAERAELAGVLLTPYCRPLPRAEIQIAVHPIVDHVTLDDGTLRLSPWLMRQVVGEAGRQPRPYRLPEKAGWEQLIVRVVDDESVILAGGDGAERRSYIELGMVDRRRRSPSPTQAWTLLLLFARNGGELGWGDAEAAGWIKGQMTHLRRHLRETTGLRGNPFRDYRSERRWKARFILTDCRS